MWSRTGRKLKARYPPGEFRLQDGFRLTIGILRSRTLRVTPSSVPTLGPLEEAVLEHLFGAGESDVATAHAAVGAPRGIASNTVGSALERLHRKGLAERWKVAHAYRYRPSLAREEWTARRVIAAAGGGGALGEPSLLAAFVDALATRGEAELERLEALIARKRAERAQ